jgi:glycosyltransferase involved in cell wall biosynthesis
MTKSLSIVIPVYNEEKFLSACLEAIANQTVLPDEVIVVDNNSTDNSMQIARNFPFVKVISEKQQGIFHARGAGYDTASSDIIARIDADTVLPRGWVSKVHRFYDSGHHDNYALTGGGYFYNLRLRRFNGWVLSQLAYRVNRLVVGHYILWGSNMAFPRSFWFEVRHKVCQRDDIHEDMDLGIHLHDLGVKITYHGNLRVGVCMKRFFTDRKSTRTHMRRWPQTLRVHGYSRWWFGVLGNWLLWYILQPLAFFLEYSARLLGKKPFN